MKLFLAVWGVGSITGVMCLTFAGANMLLPWGEPVAMRGVLLLTGCPDDVVAMVAGGPSISNDLFGGLPILFPLL